MYLELNSLDIHELVKYACLWLPVKDVSPFSANFILAEHPRLLQRYSFPFPFLFFRLLSSVYICFSYIIAGLPLSLVVSTKSMISVTKAECGNSTTVVADKKRREHMLISSGKPCPQRKVYSEPRPQREVYSEPL